MGKSQKEVTTSSKFVELSQKGKQNEIKSILPQAFSLRPELTGQAEVEAFQDLNFEASTDPV
jgi:hypothetical protein